MQDLGAVEIQVRLVGIETVPVIGLGHRVPGPVGSFKVLEDDPGFPVSVRRIAPDIEVTPGAPRFGPAGPLEPGVLIGGMVQHQFGDDPQAPAMGFPNKGFEIAEMAVDRMNPGIVGDVIAVVLQRRREKREQPDDVHSQVLEVVQLLGQSPKITEAVVVAVGKRPGHAVHR